MFTSKQVTTNSAKLRTYEIINPSCTIKDLNRCPNLKCDGQNMKHKCRWFKIHPNGEIEKFHSDR